jgi:transposase
MYYLHMSQIREGIYMDLTSLFSTEFVVKEVSAEDNNLNIKIVTRDRANSYSKAISDTLPSAIQIADKWHLLKNMTNIL